MNRSRRQAAEEPAVPLVPRLEEDEYGIVEILNVMPPILAEWISLFFMWKLLAFVLQSS